MRVVVRTFPVPSRPEVTPRAVQVVPAALDVPPPPPEWAARLESLVQALVERLEGAATAAVPAQAAEDPPAEPAAPDPAAAAAPPATTAAATPMAPAAATPAAPPAPAAPVPGPEVLTGQLDGRILCQETGQPVAGCEVQVFFGPVVDHPIATCRTDDLGTFTLADLPPGYYSLRCRAGDLAVHVYNLRVWPGDATQFEVLLPQPAGGQP